MWNSAQNESSASSNLQKTSPLIQSAFPNKIAHFEDGLASKPEDSNTKGITRGVTHTLAKNIKDSTQLPMDAATLVILYSIKIQMHKSLLLRTLQTYIYKQQKNE